MTAINLAVQPARRAAYIISDCAFTRPDGRIEKISGKIISFDRFPCAIAATGNVNVAILARALYNLDAANLRTLVTGLQSALKRALDETVAAAPPDAEGWAILKVAAWCARRKRAVGYIIASHDDAAAAIIGPGWSSYQVAEVRHSHGTHVHVSELLGRQCELDDAATFNPEADAFALVAAQRATPQLSITPGVDQEVPFRVGGAVELTEVTRRGVRVWLMGEFPDKVGELIAP
ncbi:hypothetical protein GCM10022253_30220 [Sphingomonas endophytica]|uniref:Uncharacterized protein n=1 Tax=Sphingomonas endophytica TaxID=869719 RepID=A0ABR6NA25_9SPHN|nr:hypothetical protein [Sphingomonas endophytica]MBB5726612.1 hypothetical protein [Sphingomonas endophytica]